MDHKHEDPTTLTFRLVDPSGSSMGVSSDDPHTRAGLRQDALALVERTFQRLRCPVPSNCISDKVPEIVSQRTLDYLQQLEILLEDCRNFMIDVPDHPQEWEPLLDEVDTVLGITAAAVNDAA